MLVRGDVIRLAWPHTSVAQLSLVSGLQHPDAKRSTRLLGPP